MPPPPTPRYWALPAPNHANLCAATTAEVRAGNGTEREWAFDVLTSQVCGEPAMTANRAVLLECNLLTCLTRWVGGPIGMSAEVGNLHVLSRCFRTRV